MLISYARKFIFIHIYKTAGTSITRALSRHGFVMPIERLVQKCIASLGLCFHHNGFPVHVKASDLKAQLPEPIFGRFFKFAFVRNPWDWQVSLYHYMLQSKEPWARAKLGKITSFEEYLESGLFKIERKSQNQFVRDELGSVLVDFIGRYEQLQEDFNHVCDQLEIRRIKLPQTNRSIHHPYRNYYNSKLRDIVYENFRDDIELFNYDF